MTFNSNYLKALPLRVWLCLLSIWLSVLFLSVPTRAMAQAPLEVGANTTVFFADTLNSLVWEDKSGKASLEDVKGKLAAFKPADAFQAIDPKSHYWVAQRLVNRLGENREIVVNASINKEGIHWLRYQHFVVYANGQTKELNGPYSSNIPVHMSDIDPSVFTMDTSLSRSPVFVLPRDSEVLLLSRLKSNSTYPARNFTIQLYDRASYLELRKQGLYIEGLMAGLMLALVLSSSYVLIFKRDVVSAIYNTWLVFCFLQIITLPIQDGQRLFELLFDQQPSSIGVMPSNVFWMNVIAYLQIVFFLGFGRAFLGTHRYFPRFHFWSSAFMVFEGIRFIVGNFFEHEISPVYFRIPGNVFFMLIMLGTFYCAINRVKQGLRTAKYSVVLSGSTLPFWGMHYLSLEGIHVLEDLPINSFTLHLNDTYILLAIPILWAAFVSHFSIHARTRRIEKKLSATLIAQREAAENQTKLLEVTVEERTRELQHQHKSLNAAHKEVLASVVYASRLQRGQLPRTIRIENRFSDFATLWEPRDTIGGDLWWISSSMREGPFTLAVADCTGHGVPGAMLSLLVSNSLERIYAQGTAENPALALMSLDHYVRHGLNQDRPDSESNDGCDALILRIDKAQQIIEFAGAKVNLIQITSKGDYIRHAVQRCSLGYMEKIDDADKPVLQKITYTSEDLFVIVTDGLTDQIGLHRNKRVAYGHRRLQLLLQKNHNENAQDIAQRLREDFENWQGIEPRRDDVTVVMFKL